jgi:hypothetical protein
MASEPPQFGLASLMLMRNLLHMLQAKNLLEHSEVQTVFDTAMHSLELTPVLDPGVKKSALRLLEISAREHPNPSPKARHSS